MLIKKIFDKENVFYYPINHHFLFHFQSVIVKSIERNAPNMYLARLTMLGLKKDNVNFPASCVKVPTDSILSPNNGLGLSALGKWIFTYLINNISIRARQGPIELHTGSQQLLPIHKFIQFQRGKNWTLSEPLYTLDGLCVRQNVNISMPQEWNSGDLVVDCVTWLDRYSIFTYSMKSFQMTPMSMT